MELTVPETTDERPAFCIDSIEPAEWLLRKLANLAAEKTRIQAQPAEMVAELDTYAAHLNHFFAEQLDAGATYREALARHSGEAHWLGTTEMIGDTYLGRSRVEGASPVMCLASREHLEHVVKLLLRHDAWELPKNLVSTESRRNS